MNGFIRGIYVALTVMMGGAAVAATPDKTATIIVHGFSPGGASSTGVVGTDHHLDYALDIAASLGLPNGLVDPLAPNQVAATTYYGNQLPGYYDAADEADVAAATTMYGGGVPRYAEIVAKYARQVMDRSGAEQVNLVGVSFGALVSRYIIEKDVEELASSGKIARWVCIEGVVAGNYAATHGGLLAEVFFEQYYGGSPVDLDHMAYPWVEANIHAPRHSSSSPWLADIPVHFWLAGDDNLYGKFITQMSGKANDGVVLLEDATLKNLPASLLYEGLLPTESTLHATHESMKMNKGLHAGLAAQFFGNRRVTVTLKDVRVLREFDGGNRGQGEYVFGVKFFSPLAEAMGVTDPIQDLRAEDNSFPYVNLSVNAPMTLNLPWFDDMLLPNESQLRLLTNVEEIDGDVIYQISESSGEVRQALQNTQMIIDVTKNGTYPLTTDDWTGTIEVSVNTYGDEPAAADYWSLYE